MGGLRIGGLRIFRGGGVQFCFVFLFGGSVPNYMSWKDWKEMWQLKKVIVSPGLKMSNVDISWLKQIKL